MHQDHPHSSFQAAAASSPGIQSSPTQSSRPQAAFTARAPAAPRRIPVGYLLSFALGAACGIAPAKAAAYESPSWFGSQKPAPLIDRALYPESSPRNIGARQHREQVVPATVPLIAPPDPAWIAEQREETPSATLLPSYQSYRVYAGDSFSQVSTLSLDSESAPQKGDILISFDLTGSMGGELNNVKNNSLNIMSQVRSLIPDTSFGVISYRDYPADYESCDYYQQYGTSIDYPYRLDQGITNSTASINTAISSLALGDGYDSPEDYGRALMEAARDPNVGWRQGARRILLNWGDDIPHDCQYDAIIGGESSTGKDPGRDGEVDTADDIPILDAIAALKAQEISLLALHSGNKFLLPVWDAYAAQTGGDAVQINSNGTIPGGINIATYIASLIQSQLIHLDTVELQTCRSEDADWLAGVSPSAYHSIDLSVPHELDFDLSLKVPEGTATGTHCFDICAVADGAEYTSQRICVEVAGCGDGVLEGHEACDDGNAHNGDGCSDDCQLEAPVTPTPSAPITPMPTAAPTDAPTHAPTDAPVPTHAPTDAPVPTHAPTDAPEPTPVLTPELPATATPNHGGEPTASPTSVPLTPTNPAEVTPTATNAPTSPHPSPTPTEPSGGCGTLVGVFHNQRGALVAIDTTTGLAAPLAVNAQAVEGDAEGITSLAWSETDNALWMVAADSDDSLYSVSLDSGEAGKGAHLGATASNIQAMDFAPEIAAEQGFAPGHLYGVSIDGLGGCGPNCLFELDRKTGSVTALGSVPLGQVRGMSFDPTTGELWVYNAENKGLYILDSTGAATLQFQVPSSHHDAGTGIDTMFSIAHGCDGMLYGVDIAYGVLLEIDPDSRQAYWVGDFGDVAGPGSSFDLQGLEMIEAESGTVGGTGTTPAPTESPAPPTATPTPEPTPTPVPTGESCSVIYTVPGEWPVGGSQHGFLANVTFTNTGSFMNGWEMSWTFGGDQRVTSLWNGTFEQTGPQVIVEAMPYNAFVPAGQSVSFGFLGEWAGSNKPPTTFRINGVTCVRATR